MDHDEASLLIPEVASGRLDGARASEAERHARDCAACRDALAFHRRVAAEVATHRGALFEDHVAPPLLVDFALEPGSLPDAERARVAAHVGACPTCRREMASVRKAEAAATSPWRAVADLFPAGALPAPIPALVPALVVLFLAYPAYLGLVRLPQVIRECDLAHERLAQITGSGAGPAARWDGGPVLALTLAAPLRGEDAPAAPLPAVRVQAGQPYQPIRIECDLSRMPDDRKLLVTLRAAGESDPRWKLEATAAALWDAADEAINLLIPASRLDPGEFRLEIVEMEPATTLYSSGFRIVE